RLKPAGMLVSETSKLPVPVAQTVLLGTVSANSVSTLPTQGSPLKPNCVPLTSPPSPSVSMMMPLLCALEPVLVKLQRTYSPGSTLKVAVWVARLMVEGVGLLPSSHLRSVRLKPAGMLVSETSKLPVPVAQTVLLGRASAHSVELQSLAGL